MDLYLKITMTLAGILGCIGILAWGFKKFGGQFSEQFMNPPRKRLEIIDSLVLDPKRRVVLIRKDNREHLILVGGTQVMVVDSYDIPQSHPLQQPHHPTSVSGEVRVAPHL
jgi:flagellar protein FliO/FliZ